MTQDGYRVDFIDAFNSFYIEEKDNISFFKGHVYLFCDRRSQIGE